MQRYEIPLRDETQTIEPLEQVIIGESPLIQQVRRLVRQVAHHSRVTVLLQGESGTGKDVVARAIHVYSQRAAHNFVAINCAALPETLIETELFGVESGAFTDAKVAREGHLQRAHGGTLFLDEIGEMPLMMQAKLLRFLETHRFHRVGSVREQHVDVRVIAATNVDLRHAISQRTFREDLFYRLNVVGIHLSPLRTRPEDIPSLVAHYLQKHYPTIQARKPYASSSVKIHPETMERLMRYDWPGNVRELFAVLQSSIILCDGNFIMPHDLPSHIQTGREQAPQHLHTLIQHIHLPPEGLHLRSLLETIEKTLIQEALERCNGNQVQAASLLHLSRDQLRYRLPKL